MGLVVTDGLRQKLKMTGGWNVYGFEPWIDQIGNHLYRDYLLICRERLVALTAPLGYGITWWHGEYGEPPGAMTYYGMVLTRGGVAD